MFPDWKWKEVVKAKTRFPRRGEGRRYILSFFGVSYHLTLWSSGVPFPKGLSSYSSDQHSRWQNLAPYQFSRPVTLYTIYWSRDDFSLSPASSVYTPTLILVCVSSLSFHRSQAYLLWWVALLRSLLSPWAPGTSPSLVSFISEVHMLIVSLHFSCTLTSSCQQGCEILQGRILGAWLCSKVMCLEVRLKIQDDLG